MWWKLLNEWDSDLPSAKDEATASRGAAAEPDEEEDEALRAWNRYLREMRDAELEAQDQAAYASDPAESPLKRS